MIIRICCCMVTLWTLQSTDHILVFQVRTIDLPDQMSWAYTLDLPEDPCSSVFIPPLDSPPISHTSGLTTRTQPMGRHYQVGAQRRRRRGAAEKEKQQSSKGARKEDHHFKT